MLGINLKKDCSLNTIDEKGVSIAPSIPEPSVLEEEFTISPEHLEFARCYLTVLDLNETAKLMRMSLEDVTRMMNHRSVRTVVDQAFLDQGYMNRGKISAAMTGVIEAKMSEMEETELVSGKDISELLMMAHKMRMEELKMQQKNIELENLGKARVGTAVQITNVGDSATSNYTSLLKQIVSGGAS
jgi:hypothetical protein